MRISFENLMLSEISQTQKNRHTCFTFVVLEVGKFTDTKWTRDSQGLGERNGRSLFNGDRNFVWGHEKFWRWTVLMIVQHWKCT